MLRSVMAGHRPGHPRSWRRTKNVDARVKPGHDEMVKALRGRLQPRKRPSVPGLEMAHVLLAVELEPDAIDEVQLRLEKVDVALLVLHQALEQVARDVVLDAMAVGRRFLVERTRRVLRGEVALEDLLD